MYLSLQDEHGANQRADVWFPAVVISYFYSTVYKREDFTSPPRIFINCGCKTSPDHNDALCPCKPRKFNPTTHTSACKCGRPATNKKR